jgi:cytidylate kinase
MAARMAAIVASLTFGRGGVSTAEDSGTSATTVCRGGDVHVSPVVTLAALYGVGGSAIGQRVADRLGVRFLDRAIPSSVAERAGVPEAAVAEADDGPRSRWSEIFDAFGRASPPNGASGQPEGLDLEHRRLHAEIERFLADASRTGGVVVGRGGAVVLASLPAALHVHLGGDREARIGRVMEHEQIERTTAARRVTVHDRARRDYVRSAYGIDGDDPALYHLMIDAISLGVDVCIDLIVAASASFTRPSAPVGTV